jgi:PAS domain S-box-containing protein
MNRLGSYVKKCREALQARHSGYSIRALARRIGMHHSYLSKLERGENAPLSEERIMALSRELGEDPEVLLALSGRLSEQTVRMVAAAPQRFLTCLRDMEQWCPAHVKDDATVQRLRHRKQELETLNRRLRDEISKNAALQRKLGFSEARWKFALEGAQEGVWDYDFQTGKVYYSRRWKEIIGCAEHEFGDRLENWEALIHPDDREGVQQSIDRHIRKESEYFATEYRLRCCDGTYKWILDRGMIVERDAAGHPLRAIGTIFDITRQHMDQEALRDNEAFLKSLLHSIQDGICVLDSDLVIQFTNPTMERWHASSMPLTGKKCHQAFHLCPQPCTDCPSLRSMRSQCTESREVAVQGEDGPRWIELFSYPLINGNGAVDGVIEFVRDITQAKMAEERLQAIITIQEVFIQGDDLRRGFSQLLCTCLRLTQSAYGFIGEVLEDAGGRPYLHTYSLTDIAWDLETRRLFEQYKEKGFRFDNLQTLFGAAITSGKAVVANNPGSDPRCGGLPPGHPPIHSFLGLPITGKSGLVALLGLANRPGGYDQGVIDFLHPLLKVCGSIITARRRGPDKPNRQ